MQGPSSLNSDLGKEFRSWQVCNEKRLEDEIFEVKLLFIEPQLSECRISNDCSVIPQNQARGSLSVRLYF